MGLSVSGVRFGIFFCWTAMLNSADGDTPGAKRCSSSGRKMEEVLNSGLVLPVDASLSLGPTLLPFPKE